MSSQWKTEKKKVKRSQKPYWAGIGCVLLVVVPVAGWFLGGFTEGWAYDQQWYFAVRAAIREPLYRQALWATLYIITTLSFIAIIYGIVTRKQFEDPVAQEMRQVLEHRKRQREAQGRNRRRGSR